MSNIYYHILLGLCVSVTLAIRVFFDARSSTRRRRVDGKRSLNITYVFFAGAYVQILGIFDITVELSEPYNTLVRTVGLALAPIACVFITWPRVMNARRRAWASPATIPSVIPEHRLVTEGPYRFVRHPYNTGLMLGIIATEFSLLSVFVLFVPVAVVYLVRKLRKEEAQLEEVYGEDYRLYKARTPACIPRLIR